MLARPLCLQMQQADPLASQACDTLADCARCRPVIVGLQGTALMKVDRRKHCAERGPADLLGRASACALALLFGLLLVWAPLAASLEAPTRIRQGHAIGQIAVKPADARQRCPKKASQGQPSACAFSGVSLA